MLNNIERMTITLPIDMAAMIKGTFESGSCVSSSEVIREALRDWNLRRAAQLKEFVVLKADIGAELADRHVGRIKNFNAGRAIALGRKKLKSRSR